MTALWANFNEQAGSDDMEEYCRGIPVSAIKPWLQQVNPYPTNIFILLLSALSAFTNSAGIAFISANSCVQVTIS